MRSRLPSRWVALALLPLVALLLSAAYWRTGDLHQTPDTETGLSVIARIVGLSTPTFTPTITPTPTETGTPTLTPTPLSSIAQRDIWARNGCYEGFTAVGKIPAGASVRFLPSERRFDDFNRECVLVEYQREGAAVIGWVLILDLGAGPPPTLTPSP